MNPQMSTPSPCHIRIIRRKIQLELLADFLAEWRLGTMVSDSQCTFYLLNINSSQDPKISIFPLNNLICFSYESIGKMETTNLLISHK